tara:strand:- start:449 stop:2623 length:2175 start_codon:yes stop_codon:yes gene_type:complete
MNITFNHIKQLKKLPKHGQDNLGMSPEELKEFKDTLNSIDIDQVLAGNIDAIDKAVTNLGNAFKIATDDGKKLGNALDVLTNKSTVLQGGITGTIGIQQKLGKVSEVAVGQITKLEQAFGHLNKRYGLTRRGSGDVASGFALMGKEINTDIGRIQKYAAALQNFIPLQTFALTDSTDTGTKALFQLSDMLSKNLQLTDAQTEGYLRFNASQNALGISAVEAGEAVADAFAEGDPEKKSMFFKQIAEDIGSAGAVARIQYGRTAGSLEKAVLQSRKLGISLADVNTAGRKMLDIESSVGQELEYQLLTGNRLVDQSGKSLTAEMRKATISGNASKQAEIMSTIMEQEGDTLRNNLFAREQMAELLGMSEEKLAGMLEKQKFISQYGLDDADVNLSTDELQKKLIAAVKSDEALTEKQMKEQIDAIKASAEKMDTRTTQEQNSQEFQRIQTNTLASAVALAKLADIEIKDKDGNTIDTTEMSGFAKLFEGSAQQAKAIADPLATTAQVVGETIVESENLTRLVGTIDALGIVADPVTKKLEDAAKNIPVLGKIASAVGTAASITSVDQGEAFGTPSATATTTNTNVTDIIPDKLQDGIVPAAAGSKILRVQEGALRIRDIQLNDNDDVIAGTNLFGPSLTPSPEQQALADVLGISTDSLPGATTDPINYEKLAAIINTSNNSNMNTSNTNLIDYERLAEAMSRVTINATMDPMGSSTTMTKSPWVT